MILLAKRLWFKLSILFHTQKCDWELRPSCSPSGQCAAINPLPDPIFITLSQTNPYNVCTSNLCNIILEWNIIHLDHKHYSALIQTQSFTHLFFFVVYDDQIWSSLQTVSSAVGPVIPLRGNVVGTALVCYPFRAVRALICSKNSSQKKNAELL